MTTISHPDTGAPMQLGVRSRTITHMGLSATFDMPGWYAEDCEDGIHAPCDEAVLEHHLSLLRARAAAYANSVAA